MTEVL
jgi:hypothetical protein